jgi:hypothetical protein
MLKNIISDNINNINIYYYNNNNDNDIKTCKINTFINNDKIKIIKKKYKFFNRKFVSYWYKNLEYIYELSNDNQCLFKYEILDLEKKTNSIVTYYNEIKLPVYYFPSLYDISYKKEYSIDEHKLNNRLSLCIKENSIYINYKYNKNIDFDINNELIKSIFKYLLEII